MKRLHSILAGLFLMMCMTALAQTQPPTAPSQPDQPVAASSPSEGTTASTPANAMLRVYRHRRAVGSALAPSIYVDDKQIARVGNGRRVTIKLAPGPHTVRSDDKSSLISIEAKAGQEYYIRIDEAAGFWKGHGKLTLLMPEQGAPEYKLQKPIEEDRKVAKEMIADDAETAAK
jgi:hypothetical protein